MKWNKELSYSNFNFSVMFGTPCAYTHRQTTHTYTHTYTVRARELERCCYMEMLVKYIIRAWQCNSLISALPVAGYIGGGTARPQAGKNDNGTARHRPISLPHESLSLARIYNISPSHSNDCISKCHRPLPIVLFQQMQRWYNILLCYNTNCKQNNPRYSCGAISWSDAFDETARGTYHTPVIWTDMEWKRTAYYHRYYIPENGDRMYWLAQGFLSKCKRWYNQSYRQMSL